jgi:hypothetical protein
MNNSYKRLDVFRCNQDAHQRFEGRVSVYHVLKEKACYPQGCIYFLWRCSRIEKGEPCMHRYRHAGKNCTGCTYYIEEKVHLQPTRMLTEPDYNRFIEELEVFETWLEGCRYRRLQLAGRIAAVKPWFEHILFHHQKQIKLLGFLLVFRRGYIGIEPLDDTFYIRISERLQKLYSFVPKMKVELEGEIREDRGRIVVHKPGKIEILSKGWGKPWKKERALVAVRTASLLYEQPEPCLGCPWGALADTTDRNWDPPRLYRNLFCLKGILDPHRCTVRLKMNLNRQTDPRT